MFKKVEDALTLICTGVLAGITGVAISARPAMAGDYQLGNLDGQNYGPLISKTTVAVCNDAPDLIVDFVTTDTEVVHGLQYSMEPYLNCDFINTDYRDVYVNYAYQMDEGSEEVRLTDGQVLILFQTEDFELDHYIWEQP